MIALKAARAFTGRAKIAKGEGAYHGSYACAEVSLDSAPPNWGDSKPASVPYSRGTPPGVLDNVVALPFNDVALCEQILHAHASSLAAILIDPLPNRAGLMPASREFLPVLRSTADAHGMC